MKNINPTRTAAWQALQQHFEQMKSVQMRDLFAADADRFSKFSATFDDQMLVDYSKNRINAETLESCRRWPVKPICRAPSPPCSPVRKSTVPRTAPCCTSRCATGATRRSALTVKT
ncbi:hypothetical protein O0544_06695 [Edwardsiella anguillarum]|nr:hypothetical protein [Edwardsiella anguillarum]